MALCNVLSFYMRSKEPQRFENCTNAEEEVTDTGDLMELLMNVSWETSGDWRAEARAEIEQAGRV